MDLLQAPRCRSPSFQQIVPRARETMASASLRRLDVTSKTCYRRAIRRRARAIRPSRDELRGRSREGAVGLGRGPRVLRARSRSRGSSAASASARRDCRGASSISAAAIGYRHADARGRTPWRRPRGSASTCRSDHSRWHATSTARPRSRSSCSGTSRPAAAIEPRVRVGERFIRIVPAERAHAVELVAGALRPGGMFSLWENGTRGTRRRFTT